jgi:hypothetical protein
VKRIRVFSARSITSMAMHANAAISKTPPRMPYCVATTIATHATEVVLRSGRGSCGHVRQQPLRAQSADPRPLSLRAVAAADAACEWNAAGRGGEVGVRRTSMGSCK